LNSARANKIEREFAQSADIVGRRDWTRTNDPHHVKVDGTLHYNDQLVILHHEVRHSVSAVP